jgi:hypothetical protein
MGSSNPTPDTHVEVLQRQAFNSIGSIIAADLTQDNRSTTATTAWNNQKANNSRLNASTPKGILAGSVVAVAGNGLIGPCAGDSTAFVYDMAVGIAVNNAVGNPYESSSGAASGKIVYAHGTGTVLRTDIYETLANNGSSAITYTAGDKLYSSRNGLLINGTNLGDSSSPLQGYSTLIGVCLSAPTATDPYMMLQMRI